MRGVDIGRQEVKLSLFIDDSIIYVENPKESTKEPLDFVNLAGLEDSRLVEKGGLSFPTSRISHWK